MRTLRRGASIRLTQDRVASGKVSTLSIQMGSRCRLLAQATGVEDKYRLIGILPDSSKKGGLNGSMQHLLAVYSPEFQIPKFFLDADLSAGRLCRVRIENNQTSRFSLESTVAGARSCFRWCRAPNPQSQCHRTFGELTKGIVRYPRTASRTNSR